MYDIDLRYKKLVWYSVHLYKRVYLVFSQHYCQIIKMIMSKAKIYATPHYLCFHSKGLVHNSFPVLFGCIKFHPSTIVFSDFLVKMKKPTDNLNQNYMCLKMVSNKTIFENIFVKTNNQIFCESPHSFTSWVFPNCAE